MRAGFNLYLSCLISLFSCVKIIAQEISEPKFYITNSNITASAACVNQNTPNRSAISQYEGPASFYGPSTIFVLELSDADGVFQDPPLELARFTSATALGTTADLDFGPFAIPPTLAGENFSLRVRDIDSRLVGLNEEIPIYYFDTSEGVTLTGPNTTENNIPICPGESVTLTALPEGSAYVWFFNGNIISGESENTLEISNEGNYRAEINFGFCNNFFNFNSANISVFNFDKNNVFINEENTAPLSFCPQDTKVLTSSITGANYTYIWYLDGEAISDSSTSTFNLPQSNFAGSYTLEVSNNICSVLTDPVEVINLGTSILTSPSPQLIIVPSETIALEITTESPIEDVVVEWFRNDVLIPGANTLSITVTVPGIYRSNILINDTCMSTFEVETEVFTPVDFKLVVGQEIDCDNKIATLTLDAVLGITSTGTEISLTEEQYAFFNFEWLKDTNPTGDTNLTLVVNDAEESNVYVLTASIISGGFPTSNSTEIPISFLADTIEIISDPELLPFGDSVTLSVTSDSSYTYQWFTNASGDYQLIEGEVSNQLIVTDKGDYRAVITNQNCFIEREITVKREPSISSVIPNAITPNGSQDTNDKWILPDEFKLDDIQVKIYDSNGRLDFEKLGGYNQDWPDNSSSNKLDLLYFYIISKNNEVLHKGTITVIR